ncbi:MAG TPA: lasso peptide biosynthesis B2 protein [Paracoccaceae bacterium]|nr:lasso peptide biosynthesis B2 protein [Paracoccaceae bacterium]
MYAAVDNFLAMTLRGDGPDWPPPGCAEVAASLVMDRVRVHGIALLLAETDTRLATWPADLRSLVLDEARQQQMWEVSHLRIPRLPEHADGWPVGLALRVAGDGVVAMAELAWARWKLVRVTAADIAELNAASAASGRHGATPGKPDGTSVARARYAVPRAAQLAPWRADCLVQAMAAQRWLGRLGIATRIVIGVDKTEGEGFLAHAWLCHGEETVTGGDVARYTVLLDQGGPQD